MTDDDMLVKEFWIESSEIHAITHADKMPIAQSAIFTETLGIFYCAEAAEEIALKVKRVGYHA